jgi:hypothetical protein
LLFPVFRLQPTNESCLFLLIPSSEYKNIYRNSSIYTYKHIHAAVSNRKQKMEAQAIFLNLFTVCSSCKRNLCFVRLLMRNKYKLSVLTD